MAPGPDNVYSGMSSRATGVANHLVDRPGWREAAGGHSPKVAGFARGGAPASSSVTRTGSSLEPSRRMAANLLTKDEHGGWRSTSRNCRSRLLITDTKADSQRVCLVAPEINRFGEFRVADRQSLNSQAIESFRLAQHRARTSRAPPECDERLHRRSRPACAAAAVPRVGQRSRGAAVRRIL